MRSLLRIITQVVLVGMVLVATNPAAAAHIYKKKAKKKGDPDTILIKGQLIIGDDLAFKRIAIDTDYATVVFDSSGGKLRPGLEIGRVIRLRGYATAVVDAKCHSACAMAWIAGSPRQLTYKSDIGFHASSVTRDNGKIETSGVGNALIGSYLNSLGFSNSVVAFATVAGPDELKRLTQARADKIGLVIEYIDDNKKPTSNVTERAVANHNLAFNHISGEKKNIQEGLRLYRESAEDGYAGSQNNLGDMYETGKNVAHSDKFAIYWYTRAAERGDSTAYLSLATLLSQGSTDEHILVEALKFGLLAVKYLSDGENKTVAEGTVKSINAKLSKKSKARAYVMADTWDPLFQERRMMSDKPKIKH